MNIYKPFFNELVEILRPRKDIAYAEDVINRRELAGRVERHILDRQVIDLVHGSVEATKGRRAEFWLPGSEEEIERQRKEMAKRDIAACCREIEFAKLNPEVK